MRNRGIRTKFAQYYFYFTIFITIASLLIWSSLDSNHTLDSNSATIFKLKALTDMKFILVWTLPSKDPIMNLATGLEAFVQRKCLVSNCYVSSDRKFLSDLREFDIVVFHAPEVAGMWASRDLPQVRDYHQKYVLASMESSDYYPICDKMFDSFFNWTWTYKLDSDEIYGYIVIRNKQGVIVGPRKNMHWEKQETMRPIDDELKDKLGTKKIAAAWFVSNCKAKNDRLELALQLQNELDNIGLTLDIYGNCGTKTCPSKNMDNCMRMVQRDYYFYLSFENSFSEDYVTEKLLHALQNYAVPVVYGGANYTRFIPDGAYLNANTLTVKELAKKISEAIFHKQKYFEYFKWHNYYTYHSVADSPETDSYCKLCAMSNDKERFRRTSIYEDIASWWNPSNKC